MRSKNVVRCSWSLVDEIDIKYHDKEWGVPVKNDKKQFEFLILEGMQAGLSWRTILNKRENFRKAFDQFDYIKIAEYKKRKVNSLMKNAGIIRNNQKIEAAINNAKAFITVRKEFGTFSKYIWSFINNKTIVNKNKSMEDIPPRTELSDIISDDLKKRGFKFVGSTIVYAHMQACGMVNDHITSCFRFKEILSLYK
jgi:DNA-3-methyladenine glycosylase I